MLGKGTFPQRTFERFQAMLHHGVLPDAISYNALISACKKSTMPQRALQLFETAAPRPLSRTVTYNSLISACEKSTVLLSAC